MPHRRLMILVVALTFFCGCFGKGKGGGSPTSPSTGVSGNPPAFTVDDGVRFQGAHPAPVVVNGMTYVYQNTGMDGQMVEASSDGVTFGLTAASFPAGVSRTIVSLPDGRFRMYYFPDAASADVRSAISSNGLNWTVEAGTRYSDPNIGAVRATALPTGGYRLYFPTSAGLGSAISNDGLTFTSEGSLSITAPDGSWGPSSAMYLGGEFHMVLTKNPASGISELWHAVSLDGRNWTLDNSALAKNPGVPLNQPAWSYNGSITRIYFRAQPSGGGNAIGSGIIRF